MMYTSGTTGKPKGVVLAQRAVVAGGEYVSSAHELTEADRVMAVLPLYHINAQIVTATAPLVHGGSLVLPQRFSANFWETVIGRAAPGSTWCRPSSPTCSTARTWRRASTPRRPFLPLGLGTAGAGQHRAFEDKFGIGIIETMGLTETAAPCFTNPLDPARRKIGSPGQAFGNEAKIIDASGGRRCRPGQTGEIMVRGDNVMSCYYKNPVRRRKSLDPDGWLHTGDLGHMDEDGFVFVTGRIKELIIKGGENIAPREIDEALLKHPALLEAAAVGIPDDNYGQEIMACVVLKPDQTCSEEELRKYCAARWAATRRRGSSASSRNCRRAPRARCSGSNCSTWSVRQRNPLCSTELQAASRSAAGVPEQTGRKQTTYRRNTRMKTLSSFAKKALIGAVIASGWPAQFRPRKSIRRVRSRSS
jgi:acyl-CoA synthetase (AMP-forming)/AMP-acid ligase II